MKKCSRCGGFLIENKNYNTYLCTECHSLSAKNTLEHDILTEFIGEEEVEMLSKRNY